MPSHIRHLNEVLSILTKNNFFIKLSKCTFACTTVEYLGHLITEGQLKVDPAKIEAMLVWPRPTSVRQLRGFLGLTGYYRRFVKHYASIAAPLTELLKKDSFKWSDATSKSFADLKEAMLIIRCSDRDPVFLNEVWEDMLRLSGAKLNFSTAYHPRPVLSWPRAVFAGFCRG